MPGANYILNDIGHNEAAVVSFSDVVKRYTVKLADIASNVYRIPVEKGALVLGVRAITTVAFNGTTPTVTAGDSASANGFLASGDVALATLGSVANSAGLGTNTYAKGKAYLSANDFVLLTFSLGSSTAGEVAVEVVYSGSFAPRPANMINNF